MPFGKKKEEAVVDAGPPVDAAEAERTEMDDVVSAVRGAVSVNRLGSTYIIEISASSGDPKKAAKLANTLAEVYLDNQLETKFEATRTPRNGSTRRVGELRDELREAESKVEAHRARTGLLRTGDTTLTEQTIRDLNAQLTSAQNEYAEKNARLRNIDAQRKAGGSIDTIAEALNSANIGNLRTRQAELAVRKADVFRNYDEKHPDYQRVLAEEQDNARQIEAELQRIASSLEQEVMIARERVNSLQGSLNRAKGELAVNNRAGVEQAALERDAQATRTLFEEFNNRFKETGELEGITEADAVVDSYAPVPGGPSFPNTKLNLMLGFMLGLALAGLAGLVIELLDNYLSSPEEVERSRACPISARSRCCRPPAISPRRTSSRRST